MVAGACVFGGQKSGRDIADIAADFEEQARDADIHLHVEGFEREEKRQRHVLERSDFEEQTRRAWPCLFHILI